MPCGKMTVVILMSRGRVVGRTMAEKIVAGQHACLDAKQVPNFMSAAVIQTFVMLTINWALMMR